MNAFSDEEILMDIKFISCSKKGCGVGKIPMIEGADDSILWICYRDSNKKHLRSENFRLRVPYEFKN